MPRMMNKTINSGSKHTGKLTGGMYFEANPTTAITLDLPDISSTSSLGLGFKYQLKNISSHNITIRPATGDTIDTSTSDRILSQYDSFTLVVGSNTDWYII